VTRRYLVLGFTKLLLEVEGKKWYDNEGSPLSEYGIVV